MKFIKIYSKKYLILFLGLFLSFASYSQKYTEYDVKAAYLYNFSKFITWPNEQKDINKNFVFVVYKNEAFAKVLMEVIKERKIKGRNCKVVLVNKPEDIPNCNILFVSNVSNIEIKNIFNFINSKPIVTVGDNIEDFCKKGGIINFTSKQSTKRFELNVNLANKKEIKISSKLIVLAKIVQSKYAVF